MLSSDKKVFFRRYLKAYLSVFAVIAVVVAISEAKGVGWRPALAGLPMYVILFVVVTYQFVKELRALKRKEPKDDA